MITKRFPKKQEEGTEIIKILSINNLFDPNNIELEYKSFSILDLS